MNLPSLFNVKARIPIRLLMISLIGLNMSNASAGGADQNKQGGDDNTSNHNSQTMAGMNKETGKKTIKKMNKEEQIEQSKQHLATELKMDQSGIQLMIFEPVTWRSGAMGCPKPGMMYTQALVPGVRILLSVEGKTYRYHAASKGEPFYCPNNRAESPSNAAGDA